ncbi:MAG: SDR family NAD(P)-dependent oxidoreductase [Sphingomonadales bacterium]
MKQLEGNVAIVTGAGRGIGKAIAIAYGREGAKVAVASRTRSTVDEVVQQIREEGGEALPVVVDVSEREQVFRMVDETVKAYGTVDIMVSNAQGFGTKAKPQGSTVFVGVEDSTDDEIRYTFDSGAMATLWAMQAVFPIMKEKKWGKIINFSSTSGILGTTGNTAYNMAKEAIRAVSRTAANEWGQFGINVNIVSPTLASDAFENWRKARPEFVTALEQALPMRYLGDPLIHGAPLCVFLASHGSDYITGQTFMLNGGKMMP